MPKSQTEMGAAIEQLPLPQWLLASRFVRVNGGYVVDDDNHYPTEPHYRLDESRQWQMELDLGQPLYTGLEWIDEVLSEPKAKKTRRKQRAEQLQL